MNLLRKYRKALLITLATVLVLAACLFSFLAGAILHSAAVIRDTLEYYVILDLDLYDSSQEHRNEHAMGLLASRLVAHKQILIELENSSMNVLNIVEPPYIPADAKRAVFDRIDEIQRNRPRRAIRWHASDDFTVPRPALLEMPESE
jgi:hypothetical protein